MQTIHLDVSNKGVVPAIYAKQGDVGRKFRAVITDNGEAYDIPADVLLSVWYSGTSGEGNYSMIGENSAFSIDGNTVTVELITQMLANHGGGNVCLVMNRQDGTQIGTWNIPYIVEQLPGMGSSAAEQYFTALSEVAGKAAESAAKAVEAAATFDTDQTLSVAGKAADAAATGEALVALGAPHNYLDNSDFRNPVNQRGQTSYTSATYCIDRWFFSNNAPTFEIVEGVGVTVTANNSSVYFNQRFFPGVMVQMLAGKKLTFAVMTDKGLLLKTKVFPSTKGEYDRSAVADGVQMTIGWSSSGDAAFVDIVVSAGTSLTLYWAALYEGEYTAETLPEYQPKGYAVELAECQRYYWSMDDSYVAYGHGGSYGDMCAEIILPVEMRVNPTTVSYTLENFMVNGEDKTSELDRIDVLCSTKRLRLQPVTLNATYKNQPMRVSISDIRLSADL